MARTAHNTFLTHTHSVPTVHGRSRKYEPANYIVSHCVLYKEIQFSAFENVNTPGRSLRKHSLCMSAVYGLPRVGHSIFRAPTVLMPVAPKLLFAVGKLRTTCQWRASHISYYLVEGPFGAIEPFLQIPLRLLPEWYDWHWNHWHLSKWSFVFGGSPCTIS